MNNETTQKTILVVDDNPTNLHVFIHTLNDAGYKIFVARSGEEAIKRAELNHPDIILLDIMMPGIDGYETCCRLKDKETTKDIPVIFITALSETDEKVKGFQTGAVDYITKPFQRDEVLVRIKTHLLIKEQQKQMESLNLQLTETNEKLIGANERLSELNSTKDKFFSIIAHDLKAAFSNLLGGAQILSKSIGTISAERIESIATQLYESVNNTYKLLENLLDWARMQRGAMEYKPSLLDLRKISLRTIALFKERALQKGVELTFNIPPKTMGFGDPQMIDTIIRNLVGNAVKFTSATKSIDVSAICENEFVKVCIKDTGVGIKPEDTAKMFRIDQSASQKGTDGERGTGLGLILCKELVEKNRGKIWVESELGKGSSFYFTIPVSA